MNVIFIVNSPLYPLKQPQVDFWGKRVLKRNEMRFLSGNWSIPAPTTTSCGHLPLPRTFGLKGVQQFRIVSNREILTEGVSRFLVFYWFCYIISSDAAR